MSIIPYLYYEGVAAALKFLRRAFGFVRYSARTQTVLVNVRDVDKHFDQARKAGAVIIDPPKDTPFGQRRYGAEDPEGHQWSFVQHTRRRSTKQR